MIPLLVAAAVQSTAVQAEHAFAAMAQTHGQWASFRAYAASEGVMFVPQTVRAQEWLKDRKEPPVPVMWWPAQSWISCDGTVAVNTGPWVREGGKSVGYFTTIWARQLDGSWKWLLDHGDTLQKPRHAGDRVKPRQASCRHGKRGGSAYQFSRSESGGSGSSADETLRWHWRVSPNGGRRVTVDLMSGSRFETVLNDEVAGQ